MSILVRPLNIKYPKNTIVSVITLSTCIACGNGTEQAATNAADFTNSTFDVSSVNTDDAVIVAPPLEVVGLSVASAASVQSISPELGAAAPVTEETPITAVTPVTQDTPVPAVIPAPDPAIQLASPVTVNTDNVGSFDPDEIASTAVAVEGLSVEPTSGLTGADRPDSEDVSQGQTDSESTTEADMVENEMGTADTVSEPEPVDALSVNLGVGMFMGERTCLSIPRTALSRGDVSAANWRDWLENYTYSGSPESLSVGVEGDSAFLTARLEPSSKGSQRVQAGANLEGAKSYRLTQSLYFEPDFDWGGSNEGGKVGFGFGGGSSPTGGLVRTDGFSLRLMWRGNGDGSAHLAAYSYAADRTQNIPFGDDYELEGFTIPTGQWFEVTMEVNANSSTDGVDGQVRMWVDNELALNREGIAWQTSGSAPSIQKLIFATFFGGNDPSWSPNQPMHVSFRDVCWAPVYDGDTFNDDAPPAEDLIFDDWVYETSRITLSDVIRDVELSLPLNAEVSNRLLVEILDESTESLAPIHWQTNDSLAHDSKTVSKVREALEGIDVLINQVEIVDAVEVDVRSMANVFANQSGVLTQRSLNELTDELQTNGCLGTVSSCNIVDQLISRAQAQLDSANGTDALIRMYSIEAAWDNVRQARSEAGL